MRPLIALIVLVFSVSSCGTDRTREEKISAIINSIDSPMLIVNTGPGELIEKSGSMDGALPFTQEMLVGFFIDEAVTGVDYDENVQVIIGKGKSFMPNYYGIFKLKNEAAFIDLLKVEANADVQEKDGFKYVIKGGGDNYVIVWNEEFAMASNIPVDFMSMMSGGGDASKEGNATVEKLIRFITSAEEGEINDEYTTFLKHKSDLAISVIGKGLYGYLNEMSMGEADEIAAYKEKIEGFNAELFLNFNVGNIDLELLGHYTAALEEELKLLKNSAVKKDIFAFGNNQNPLFTMGLNVDLAAVVDYEKGENPIIEAAELESNLELLGLTMDDAKDALNGEIFMVLDRVEVMHEMIDYGYGEPYLSTSPKPIFALIVGVQDVNLLMKILNDSTLSGGAIVQNGDAFMVMKNGYLFSSNDSLWTNKVSTGSAVSLQDKGNVYKDTPFGMFMDMASLSQSENMEQFELIGQLVSSLKGAGNLEKMNISVEFKDKSINALRSLTEFISSLVESESPTDAQMEAEIEEAVDAYDALQALEEN